MGHTLQLSVKRGLEVAKIRKCVSRCKCLVSHFKKSSKEMYKLREKQTMLELPNHEIIQDCVTRWGGT